MDLTTLRVVAQRHLPRRLLRFLQATSLWRWSRDRLPYHYERELLRALGANVRSGDSVVDVGGHLGRITIALATMVGPTGRVTAFEPFPANARRIVERAIKQNVIERVVVENKAVTEAGQPSVSLYPGRNDADAEWNITGLTVTGQAVQPQHSVPAVALDEYFPPGTRIKLVKISVQGAESLVVRGARRLIEECTPVLVVLTHKEPAGLSVRAELATVGYDLFDTNGTAVSHEGLPYVMVARRAQA